MSNKKEAPNSTIDPKVAADSSASQYLEVFVADTHSTIAQNLQGMNHGPTNPDSEPFGPSYNFWDKAKVGRDLEKLNLGGVESGSFMQLTIIKADQRMISSLPLERTDGFRVSGDEYLRAAYNFFGIGGQEKYRKDKALILLKYIAEGGDIKAFIGHAKTLRVHFPSTLLWLQYYVATGSMGDPPKGWKPPVAPPPGPVPPVPPVAPPPVPPVVPPPVAPPVPKKSAKISPMTTSGISAPKKLDDHLLDIAHAHPEGSIGGTLMRTMINRRRKLRDRFQSVTNPAKSGAASENPKGAESAKPAASEAPGKEKPAEASGKKDESKKEEKADAKK